MQLSSWANRRSNLQLMRLCLWQCFHHTCTILQKLHENMVQDSKTYYNEFRVMVGLYQHGHTVQRLGSPPSPPRQKKRTGIDCEMALRGHTRPLHYCILRRHTSPLILPSSSIQMRGQPSIICKSHKFRILIVVINFFSRELSQISSVHSCPDLNSPESYFLGQPQNAALDRDLMKSVNQIRNTSVLDEINQQSTA